MSTAGNAVALGFFDGVHKAHRKIILHTIEYAEKNGLCPLVLSFDVSPLEMLSGEPVSYLSTMKEKEELITSLGASVEFLNTDKRLLELDAEEFVRDILVDKYNIKYAVCGYNYRFGKNRAGDTSLLSELGEKYGFSVKVYECETLYGESVSSSRIKKLISEGNIAVANKLLGRNFCLRGKVIPGKHLGKSLGFPTANIFPDKLSVIPKKGVYKVLVSIENKKYSAITNVGVNPTVGGETLHTETYIPSFCGDIYEKELVLEFIDFIREEKRFSNLEELKLQINEDVSKL